MEVCVEVGEGVMVSVVVGVWGKGVEVSLGVFVSVGVRVGVKVKVGVTPVVEVGAGNSVFVGEEVTVIVGVGGRFICHCTANQPAQ